MLPRFHVDRKEPGPDASEPLGQADADDPSQCRIVGGVVVGIAGERWLRVGRMPVEQVRDPQVEAHLPDAGKIRLVVENEIQRRRSEEHTSELQSLMRISYAV